ncbi:hypothetical protein E5S67_02850 [Microcoleus sp. IPMA8]|uniref:Uncharacterized protein n=1 Tax=Microcoleus asticus IPMA8 TaxID=2563858 RepID=A0ABX2D0C1_9CYAN|nr:hypothetical protein [Microcoleus asticus IPMA8]
MLLKASSLQPALRSIRPNSRIPLRNFISFRRSLPKLYKAGVKFLCIFDESQYRHVLHSTLDGYRNEVNVVGWKSRQDENLAVTD